MRSFMAVVLAAGSLFYADADIKWIEKDHDFGLMRETDGPKTGTSRFVNLGPDTVTIFDVKPSCGCTSASFSDEPIAPGDTAVVSYTYDPYMRPGKFDKSVKVSLQGGNRYTIRIKGNVLGTPESLSTLYPVDAGDMRLSASAIDAGDVVMGRSPVFFLNAYSIPLDTIHPVVRPGSESLVCVPEHPKGGPGEIVTFGFTFDSALCGKYGPVEIPVEITPNPERIEEPVTVTVPFRAFMLPDAESLAVRQGGKNPVCNFESDFMPLGEGIPRDRGRIKAEFRISNAGSGALHPLYIGSESEAVKAGKLPKEIRSGKSASVKLEIDPGLLPDGPFRIPVDVITDDPDHPHLTLTLTGSL